MCICGELHTQKAELSQIMITSIATELLQIMITSIAAVLLTGPSS
jgi:hypothetical protein